MRYPCPKCGVSFVGPEPLQRHLDKTIHVVCPNCGKTFTGLGQHQRRAHDMTAEQRLDLGRKIGEGVRRASARHHR